MSSPLTQPLLCLFLALLFVAGTSSPARASDELERVGGGGGENQREFDYFALALQWPDGLWPDYNDGTWPSCCTKSSFDPKEISTLNDALEKYWPSLSCSKPSSCNGGKEKHGTCSYPVFGNEYDYFLTTLNLYFKYNVTSVLNDAGYVPSNTEKYPLGGIISAIENAFHASPQIICSKDSVEELRLCFYKDFKPRDCAIASDAKIDMVTSKSSCPNYVSLPEFAST
ncbi:ribonuclease 2-like protein, partial [Trifolium pratense]